jgi:hypothetical protein
MRFQNKNLLSIIATRYWIALFFVISAVAGAVSWEGPAGIKIKSVHYLKTQPQTNEPSDQMDISTLQQSEAIPPYPVPPLAGFSPLVVITTSDKEGSGDVDYEHRLESQYNGNPLTSSAEPNYIIGIYDSGAMIDLFAGDSVDILGLTGDYMTGNTFPLGGVGGSLDGLLSQPIGVFAGGLSTIHQDGSLDLARLMGHSNVSVVATPAISCDNGESVTGVVGNPFIAFVKAVIRNDQVVNVSHNGTMFSSPDVEILDLNDPSDPTYSKSIPMDISGLSLVLTSSYYPDFETLEDPIFPTLLSSSAISIPFGGAFFAEIQVVEGEPSPINPIQTMRVMVDTGAQSSIITPGMAAKLGLPFEPDFTVDVCGVGGLEPNVPGYNLDYVKINALGGAMEFSNASFVMVDLSSPDGGTLDGVLGMNFFWNRNITVSPNILGSSFIHVSDVVPYGNADFNFDGKVDMADYSILASAYGSQSPQPEYLPICDLYLDTMIDINDMWAFMSHWLKGTELPCDIAPEVRDGKVDLLDYSVFSQTWMATDTDGNWNADADFVPTGDSENIIDIEDLAVFAENWLSGVSL